MRAGSWLGVVLLVGGYSLSSLTASPSDEELDARLDFERAHLSGRVQLMAPTGALLVSGAPSFLSLDAALVEVKVVDVEREHLDNPFGGDIAIKMNQSEKRFEFERPHVALGPGDARTVFYVYRDRPDSGRFELDLGVVGGNALTPSYDNMRFTVSTPGQAHTFVHSVEPPQFGVGQGKLDAPFHAPLDIVRVAGTFSIVVDYANLTLDHDEERLTIRTGEWRTDEASVSVLTPRYRTERAYAVVGVRDGVLALGLGGQDARFLTRAPTYLLEGTLSVPYAAGTLTLNRTAQRLERQSLQVEGNLTIEPRALARRVGLLGLDRGESQLSAHVAGHADAVRVDGRSVLEPVPEELRAASLVAVVAGILVAAWSSLQKALAPFLFPLYTRLLGGELLGNRRRLQLYGLVEQRPFVHVRELHRLSGLGYGCVSYHLSMLKKRQLVSSVRVGNQELYYVPRLGFGAEEMRRLARLAHPTRRAMADVVLSAGSATQRDLARALSVSQGLVSMQLAKLVRVGLLEAAGKLPRRYAPTPLLLSWLRPHLSAEPKVELRQVVEAA